MSLSLSFTDDLAAESELLETFEGYTASTRRILREQIADSLPELRDAHGLASTAGAADATRALFLIVQRHETRLELLDAAGEYGRD